MPKPFEIRLEVEEVALGAVMRKLNGMPGIVALHFNLDTDAPKAAYKNGADHASKGVPKRVPGSVRLPMLKLLSDGERWDSMRMAEALQLERTQARLNADNAMRSGLLRRVAPGTFQITAKGHKYIAQAAALAAVVEPAPSPQGEHPLTKRLAYLQMVADGQPHSNQAIRELRPEWHTKLLHNTTDNARRAGLLRRTGKGVYQITAKGRAYIAAANTEEQ